jgi:hypothetical protein
LVLLIHTHYTMYPEASFHGYVASTQDVLLVFEACRRGMLPKIHRRLQEKERGLIQSGAIFVFDEHDSGKIYYFMAVGREEKRRAMGEVHKKKKRDTHTHTHSTKLFPLK